MSSGICLRGVPCGIQPSPRSATRRSAGLPDPPIQIGGRGCCTGRGRSPTSSKLQSRPLCSGHSSVQRGDDRVDRLVGAARRARRTGRRAPRTRLRRGRRRRRGSRGHPRARRASRTPSPSGAGAGRRRRTRSSSARVRVVCAARYAERRDRVEPLRRHHLGRLARDRDVIADRDVEEPGVVARLRDVDQVVRRWRARAPTATTCAPTAPAPAAACPYTSTPSGTIETLGSHGRRQPGQTMDCISLYAWRPNEPPSRPTPLNFMPPNGVSWLRCAVLMPTLPARSRLLDAERAVGVGAEHVVVEAEVGVVGDRDAFVLVVERDHDDHRAEDLLLHDAHVGPAAGDERRRDVEARVGLSGRSPPATTSPPSSRAELRRSPRRDRGARR